MKHYVVTSVALLLLFSSCKKDDLPQNYASQGPYTSIDNIYSKLAPVSRTVSISVSSGGSVYASGGTRFIIAPNSFQTASGVNVAGSVQVEVNDWLKKGDMIFGKVLPVAGTQSLISGGQAFIRVTQNNQPVYLKPGMQVKINLPQFGNVVPGMQLFMGKPMIGSDNTVGWGLLDTTSNGKLIYDGDTISMFSDSLDAYCNADKYMNSPNYQNVTIQANNPDGEIKGIRTVVVYSTFRAMMPLGTRENNIYPGIAIPDVPIHIVMMGLKNGNLYGGVSTVTPATGQTYTVNLSQVDPYAFKAQISGL